MSASLAQIAQVKLQVDPTWKLHQGYTYFKVNSYLIHQVTMNQEEQNKQLKKLGENLNELDKTFTNLKRNLKMIHLSEFNLCFHLIAKELRVTMVRDIAPNAQTLTGLLALRKARDLSPEAFDKYREYQQALGGSIAGLKTLLLSGGTDDPEDYAHQGDLKLLGNRGRPKIDWMRLEGMMNIIEVSDPQRKVAETARLYCKNLFLVSGGQRGAPFAVVAK